MAAKGQRTSSQGFLAPRSEVISALSKEASFRLLGWGRGTSAHLGPPTPLGSNPFAPGLVSMASEANSRLLGPPHLPMEDAREIPPVSECMHNKGKTLCFMCFICRDFEGKDFKEPKKNDRP